ncbi:MAG: DUF427 domain-containing protein [Acidimicrobiales bacterium]|nr:DUF427 domain-containing protein [Acidimicrobiales bacterium]
MATPEWLQRARDQWTYTGATRPPFAIDPGADQESVWDYPRPPAVVPDTRLVEVRGPTGLIASTTASVRVMETSLPPSFYLPPNSIEEDALVIDGHRSHCEWKGEAEYLRLPGGSEVVGWRYPRPYDLFADYAGWVSFYPDRVDCSVAGEKVRPQNSHFYGGWITSELVGPFKGDPGVPSL